MTGSSRMLGRRQTLDWKRVGEWTRCLIEENLGPIALAFADGGTSAPMAVWDPGLDALSEPILRFMRDHWYRLRGHRPLPHIQDIEPLDLKPALGRVMLLDAIEDVDFRYRLYGTTLARHSGFDMTGRLLSEFPASAYVVEFSLALNRAC